MRLLGHPAEQQEKLFPPYAPKPAAPDQFFLLFGRVAQQAHGQSGNNLLLHELRPQNELWIHSSAAGRLGIRNGAPVRIRCGDQVAQGQALVTDRIHPQAVFMLHGFGRTVPLLSRSFGRGMADQMLQRGKLFDIDPAGGGLTLTETQVTVEPVDAAAAPAAVAGEAA
jgi:thiosulfate reductase / polysulfide reductase chain A